MTPAKSLAEHIEIRIAGRGGQGILFASNLLASALSEYYPYVSQSGSYGSEARGTISSADVVAAPEVLSYPKVQQADVLALLTQEAAEIFAPAVTPNAIILYDPDMVKKPTGKSDDITYHAVPAARTANELGSSLHLNTVLLGAISAVLGSVPELEITVESFRRAIEKRFSKQRAQAGLTAFDIGRSLIQA
jgi:2-oxoglutarate ferredoxin oxidoreductase subunit gamma